MADRTKNRLRAAGDFTVPGYSDVRLIAAGVDVVSVATPTTSHADVVNTLLQAGVHVLVEKADGGDGGRGGDDGGAGEDTVACCRWGILSGSTARCWRFRGDQGAAFIECHRLSPFRAARM